MLRAMFSGRMETTSDTDGYTLIDRCGKHFEKILNYLRDEDCICNELSDNDLQELLNEAKFYCIQPLILLLENKITTNKNSISEPYYGSAVVAMVTSKNELTKILASTEKVILIIYLILDN